jgi:hypothetical protein
MPAPMLISDYEVRLRKKMASNEAVIVPIATGVGITKMVMGITSPNTYEQLDPAKHRKVSGSDIIWAVHGNPDDVFGMIAEWRRHGNIEVTLIKETQHN